MSAMMASSTGVFRAEQPRVQRLAAVAHRVLYRDIRPGGEAVEGHGDFEEHGGHADVLQEDAARLTRAASPETKAVRFYFFSSAEFSIHSWPNGSSIAA
jgi:hypothetical protein